MKSIFRIIPLFCLALVFSHCKKDHSVLGVDVQPEGDKLNTNYNATAPVYAHTVLYDSIFCANDRYKFLGSNADPVFGRTDVGLYVNSAINLTALDFGGDATLRSAEIVLLVDNFNYIGDASAQLTYSVFAIDSALSTKRLYYTNNTKLHNSKTLITTATAGISVFNGKPVVRIPIGSAYANAVLKNPAFLANDSVYQATYKGFYITAAGSNLNPTGAQGIIYKCDLDDDVSGFYLNYQNGTPSATKADKSFRFPFAGETSVKFNTVKYTPSNGGNANLVDQVVNKDTTKGAENLFLKGLGTTKLKVYIPSLSNYADSNVSINRAEVIFNIDQSFLSPSGLYAPPPYMALLPMDASGREIYARDQSDNSRYDGTYDATNQRYTFNIARHAQLIAEGKIVNYGFYLVVANTAIIYSNVYDGPAKELALVRRDDYAQRVVLAGSNKGALKPVFNITYVKLNKR